MGERSRTIVLLLCLLLLVGVLAGLSAALTPMAVQTQTAAVTETVTSTSYSNQSLMVAVVQLSGTNASSAAVPVADASVAVTRIPSLVPLEYKTNSSGEVVLPLIVGSYTVSVSDAQFQKSTNVTVDVNSETKVSVTVTKFSYPALFSDLPDPYSSASVAPWSYFTLAVASSPAIPLNSSLFIDQVFRATNSSASSPSSSGDTISNLTTTTQLSVRQVETPVRVISSDLQAYGGSETLWLTLQPENFMPLSGLASINLATYSAAMQVTIHAN